MDSATGCIDSPKLILNLFLLLFHLQFPHLSFCEQHLISNSLYDLHFHFSPSPFHLPVAVIQITIFYLGCIFSLGFFSALTPQTIIFYLFLQASSHTRTPPHDDTWLHFGTTITSPFLPTTLSEIQLCQSKLGWHRPTRSFTIRSCKVLKVNPRVTSVPPHTAPAQPPKSPSSSPP